MLKLTTSLLALGLMISTAQASVKVDEPGYLRPGTGYRVLAKPGAEPSPVEAVLKKNEDLIKPTASLTALEAHFSQPCRAEGFAREVFDIFSANPADVTASSRAVKLLPDNHVLAVHKFEQALTQQGEKAVVVQNATAVNDSPAQYEGVLKYQTEDKGLRLDVSVLLDLTGGKKPVLSIEKSVPAELPAEKDDFRKELEALSETGKLHVAIYAPKGHKIPDSTGGSKAINQKFSLPVEVK